VRGDKTVKTLYEQKANKCRHFNGMMNKVCEAGVAYETVRKSGGRGYALPCFKDDSAEHPECNCDKQSFKTHEEIAAEIEESDRRFQNTMTARMAIVEHLGGPWKRGSPGVSASIACPVCKAGTLRFNRAAVNGHIHARCSTADCVAWME
jgi:rubredoxin